MELKILKQEFFKEYSVFIDVTKCFIEYNLINTAILNKLTLVTRNEDDFKKIRELKIYNPFLK